MICYDFGFLAKVIQEVVNDCLLPKESFDIEFDDKTNSASFDTHGKTLFIAYIQSSLVEETPALIRIIKFSIHAKDLIIIAEKIQEILGERAKITLN